MLLQKNTKLLMIGDSITDCGRLQPVDQGWNGTLRGYVSMIDAHLQSSFPELNIQTINRGFGGNTTPDLKARWQSDVMDLSPDWLSVMIGVNDVWRPLDAQTRKHGQYYLDEYKEIMTELVSQTRPSVKGMVLMTPFYVIPDAQDGLRMWLDQYGHVLQVIAEEHQCLFIDTQAAFNELLKHKDTKELSPDRVHLYATGHMLLARLFLQSIGFQWS